MNEFLPEFLRAVVDTLLPGLPATENQAALPSAGRLGVDNMLTEHLRTHPHRESLAHLLHAVAQLAGDANQFAAADDFTRTALIQALERADTRAFHAFLLIVAADYYQAEEVIRAFGWPVAPPQPSGYPLPPFDEGLLAKVKQREKLWRES